MIQIRIDDQGAIRSLAHIAQSVGKGKKLYGVLGEALRAEHKKRFEKEQTSPDGKKWQPLAPWYKAGKSKNANKILVRDGYLKNLLRYQASDKGVVFGSDRPYASLHQFGGTITPKRAKRLRLGNLGYAKKVKVPARPWLGLSRQNKDYLLGKTEHFLRQVMRKA